MKHIWFNKNNVDFEYNKYRMLGFVKKVKQDFSAALLYPSLDRVSHMLYDIKQYKCAKSKLNSKLEKQLTGIDIKRLQLQYKSIDLPNEAASLDKIVAFNEKILGKTQQEGIEISNFLSNQLNFIPLGIIPNHNQYGYLFLSNTTTKNLSVYAYEHSIYADTSKQKFVSTTYIDSFALSLGNTYNHIKTELLKNRNNYANPATYVVESKIYIPFEATFLPIAKQVLAQHLNAT